MLKINLSYLCQIYLNFISEKGDKIIADVGFNYIISHSDNGFIKLNLICMVDEKSYVKTRIDLICIICISISNLGKHYISINLKVLFLLLQVYFLLSAIFSTIRYSKSNKDGLWGVIYKIYW